MGCAGSGGPRRPAADPGATQRISATNDKTIRRMHRHSVTIITEHQDAVTLNEKAKSSQ
jgi:hypothetical protein